ncbi:MAG: DegT/DnrJ/EryC1/StrS family aminotransferase [Tannerella sp.]|jgi:dTDP-4-amino-4,6-dideoxygalactose transaminase|nr:DegT/DnrJ/EryC1/StrS family aminotransferase [Tannerella sp.]
MPIQMVDLSSQYLRLKEEIDRAVQDVFKSAEYINGAPVKNFSDRLAAYLNIPHVIPCGNGTDALRIALQALNIGPENDVIVPAFTYIAPIEAIASVGAAPIVIDVDPQTFNLNPDLLERAITVRTKAVIAVHLFGQSCNIEAIQKIADKYKLAIIEDNAQSLGADYIFNDGRKRKLGTIGRVGITSFFPTKPLACYGDGGALFTSDAELAERIRLLTNHGQTEKYHHKLIGSNSRLDTVQAAILNVKLNYMDEFAERRRQIAVQYDRTLKSCPGIILPSIRNYSTHVYHQYTIRVEQGKRDALKSWLAEKGIRSMIYYPLPVHEQEAYKWVVRLSGDPSESKRLCREVLSLPIYPEMTDETQTSIIKTIGRFFF